MSKVITLAPVGEFVQDDEWEEEYESKNPVAVPLLDGQALTFELLFEPDDSQFLLQAQQLLDNFFQLTVKNRNQMSEAVWQNCKEFLEAIEYDEDDQPLHDIQQADDIWQFVEPTSIQIMRDGTNDKLFLLIYCDCDWEQEHGLQLTLREGKVLTAVSAIVCYCKDDGLEIDLLDT